MNRRRFLTAFAAATVPCLTGHGAPPAPRTEKPRVGAIRWDAWYDPDDGTVAQAVERSLGPAKFHYRMPFFGQETGASTVRINGCTQEIIDQEIDYAAHAGLAYWAFCTYAPASPLSNALRLYLSSAKRATVDFCLITGTESSIPYFHEQTEYELRLMREPGYMKVLDGRPLCFVLSSSDQDLARQGGWEKIREKTNYVRSELQRSGHGNPYFVLSEGNPDRAAKLVRNFDFDAVGLYATAVGPFGGAPYPSLVKETEAYWEKLSANGLPVVPNIMTGWDTRPRLENPPPWNHETPRTTHPSHYYQQATPNEIAQHVAHAVDWIEAHPAKAPANTALIYAWNECDEGYGALLPSFLPGNPQGDTSRIDALSQVLNRTSGP